MSSPGTETSLTCYRHPRTETAVSCSNCERPICTDCMVFSSVGIKCPECAGTPTGARKKAKRARASVTRGAGVGIVTRVMIGLNLAVFLVQVAQAGRFDVRFSEVFNDGALWGPGIADGEWWRLVTSAFLHANLIHILFNGLMLWWFARALEDYLGRVRFLGIYLVSILAGAAGSLLFVPETPTVGASGAVFGILGAGLVLERRGTNVFGGSAFLIVALNIVFTLLISNVSIGGHLGGLAGGALATLALMRFGRGHAAYGRLGLVGIAGIVLIGVASVVIAYARVRGLA